MRLVRALRAGFRAFQNVLKGVDQHHDGREWDSKPSTNSSLWSGVGIVDKRGQGQGGDAIPVAGFNNRLHEANGNRGGLHNQDGLLAKLNGSLPLNQNHLPYQGGDHWHDLLKKFMVTAKAASKRRRAA